VKDDAILLFVDAIEDDEAWLLVGEKRHRVPRAILPTGAREGTWLRLAISAAPAEVKDIDERRAHLLRGDPGGKIKL
jgi:hypothetical protein